MRPVVWLVCLMTIMSSAAANEQLGRFVRQVADACVGRALEVPDMMRGLALASRTATSVCSCAAEGFVFSERQAAITSPANILITTPLFRQKLVNCTEAGIN